jgi:uncharacterized OB-fold protein
MFGCGCGSILGYISSSRQDNTGTREVIREVVVIPCKYCGTLFPQTATFCPHCGARRTA